MKTRKGGVSGSKKALNYDKQGRQAANANVAGTQNNDPCNKVRKFEPPMHDCRWQHWLEFNLASITFSHINFNDSCLAMGKGTTEKIFRVLGRNQTHYLYNAVQEL